MDDRVRAILSEGSVHCWYCSWAAWGRSQQQLMQQLADHRRHTCTGGRILTADDTEPPVGSIVECLGDRWVNHGGYWLRPDYEGDPVVWAVLADPGQYGPAKLLHAGP